MKAEIHSSDLVMERCADVLHFHSGSDGRATMASLCRFAQECAWHHADALGFGFAQLQVQGLAWVLREQGMRVLRFPMVGEKLRILTWPTRVERILCYRDFRFEDHNGALVALATSAWLGLDVNSRRPSKTEKFFSPNWDPLPPSVFDSKLPEFAAPQCAEASTTRMIRASDIDALGHVNNVRYVEWIADYCAELGFAPRQIQGLQIRYVRELTVTDRVVIAHDMRSDDSMCLSMTREKDGREACVARIVLGRS